VCVCVCVQENQLDGILTVFPVSTNLYQTCFKLIHLEGLQDGTFLGTDNYDKDVRSNFFSHSTIEIKFVE